MKGKLTLMVHYLSSLNAYELELNTAAHNLNNSASTIANVDNSSSGSLVRFL